MATLAQLHSVFSRYTQTERELSALVESGVVRTVQLPVCVVAGGSCGGGEVGVVLSSTYVSLLDGYGDVFSAFATWARGPGRGVLGVSAAELCGQGVTQGQILRLVELGFLALGEHGYTVRVPGMGGLLKNLRGGNKELLRTLKRQPHGEVLEKVRVLVSSLGHGLIPDSHHTEVEGEYPVVCVPFTRAGGLGTRGGVHDACGTRGADYE
jgi:Serine-threonine protein kinase 19